MDGDDQVKHHAEELAAGFAAAIFAMFLTNLSLDDRSPEADYGLLLLCLSQPLAVAWWMHFRSTDWPQNFVTLATGTVGYLGGLAGIGLTIYHVNALAVAVLGAAACAAIVVGAYSENFLSKKD